MTPSKSGARYSSMRTWTVVLLLGVATMCAVSSSAPGAFQSESLPQTTVLKGVGKRVLTISFAKRDPVVVTATHNGSSNFIVHLVKGSNTDFLVNEIGPFNGQVLLEEVSTGRYRIVVDADGAWVLKFAQGLSPSKRIPGSLAGQGDRVIAVRAKRTSSGLALRRRRSRDMRACSLARRRLAA